MKNIKLSNKEAIEKELSKVSNGKEYRHGFNANGIQYEGALIQRHLLTLIINFGDLAGITGYFSSGQRTGTGYKYKRKNHTVQFKFNKLGEMVITEIKLTECDQTGGRKFCQLTEVYKEAIEKALSFP